MWLSISANKEVDVYVPKAKHELVEFLTRHYKEPKSKFNNKKKNQLYAIYFKTRKELEQTARKQGVL
jgi:hypothetical protein